VVRYPAARRHWTEQWRHDQVGRRPLPNITEFINLSVRDLISDDFSFLLAYLFSNYWLACHAFSFQKAFVKCPSLSCKRHFWWRQIWRNLHVTILHCWANFSNALVGWSIRMIHAKKYETVSKFVKVMPRILWPLFSPDTVYLIETQLFSSVEARRCENESCIGNIITDLFLSRK